MSLPYPLYDRSGVDDEVVRIGPDPVPLACTTTAASAASSCTEARAKRWFNRRVAAVVTCLVLATAASLATLGVVGSVYPPILSPGLIAFTFGLRHAVDMDHIAAIDNVTRKLIAQGQRPLLVGFFFSLGHSTVVTIMCIAVACTSGYAAERIPDIASYGGVFGSLFSSAVLFLFGIFNACTARRLWKAWRRLRREPQYVPAQAAVAHEHEHDGEARHTHIVAVVPRGGEGADRDELAVEGPGCLVRSPCCRLIFAAVDRPWKLYPVGFLFGLGFDTATEVALLAMTAALPGASSEVPWAATLVLPLVFTSGMALLDTLDGILMYWAYGWSSIDRGLQLWFNISLTATSGTIAIVIGVLQVLGLAQEEWSLEGWFWDPIAAIGEETDIVGGCIIGFFVLSLAGAALYARFFLRKVDGPATAVCEGGA